MLGRWRERDGRETQTKKQDVQFSELMKPLGMAKQEQEEAGCGLEEGAAARWGTLCGQWGAMEGV